MKLLITGGCGFIGINFIRYLLDKETDIKIRILDNLSVGQPIDILNLPMRYEDEIDFSWDKPLTLFKGDIRDLSTVDKACHEATAILHLAANTGVIPSIEDPSTDLNINVLGTFNLLHSAVTQKVSRFVLASSSAPLGEQIPPVHELMAPRPRSPYGASKLAAEGYASAFYHSFGLDTVSLRFSNVYGPHSHRKNSVVAKFIKEAICGNPLVIFGPGDQTRDFIYVNDLCSAIFSAITTQGIGGEVFQIATNQEHTINDLAVLVNKLSQKYKSSNISITKEPIRDGEVKRSYSDISKASLFLKWEPKQIFEDGIEKTFQWFCDH